MKLTSSGLVLLVLSIALFTPPISAGREQSPEAAPPPELGADGQMRWGSDARAAFLASLDKFFHGKTGDYGSVLDDAKRQPDGKYRIADQFRLPLYGLASLVKAMPDGTVIYQAFVHRNPYVRCFIKASAAKEIIAAALTNLRDIRQDGKVINVKPRIVIIFKTESPPADLASKALNQMREYYKQGGVFDPAAIELVSKKLPTDRRL